MPRTIKTIIIKIGLNVNTNNNNCSEQQNSSRFSFNSCRSENELEMEAYYMWERVHITEDMSRSCSSCDCITYSYFLISVFLFTLGSIISVFSFGAFDDTVFANLGHMRMVGPLCICSAIMIGIRNVLYLRRRRAISIVLRQQIEVIIQ